MCFCAYRVWISVDFSKYSSKFQFSLALIRIFKDFVFSADVSNDSQRLPRSKMFFMSETNLKMSFDRL